MKQCLILVLICCGSIFCMDESGLNSGHGSASSASASMEAVWGSGSDESDTAAPEREQGRSPAPVVATDSPRLSRRSARSASSSPSTRRFLPVGVGSGEFGGGLLIPFDLPGNPTPDPDPEDVARLVPEFPAAGSPSRLRLPGQSISASPREGLRGTPRSVWLQEEQRANTDFYEHFVRVLELGGINLISGVPFVDEVQRLIVPSADAMESAAKLFIEYRSSIVWGYDESGNVLIQILYMDSESVAHILTLTRNFETKKWSWRDTNTLRPFAPAGKDIQLKAAFTRLAQLVVNNSIKIEKRSYTLASFSDV